LDQLALAVSLALQALLVKQAHKEVMVRQVLQALLALVVSLERLALLVQLVFKESKARLV
jgi:hypothetical protein